MKKSALKRREEKRSGDQRAKKMRNTLGFVPATDSDTGQARRLTMKQWKEMGRPAVDASGFLPEQSSGQATEGSPNRKKGRGKNKSKDKKLENR